jgi:hypothetical protein
MVDSETDFLLHRICGMLGMMGWGIESLLGNEVLRRSTSRIRGRGGSAILGGRLRILARDLRAGCRGI